MELHFFRPRVFSELFPNFSFCLEIGFREIYKSKIKLNVLSLIKRLPENLN